MTSTLAFSISSVFSLFIICSPKIVFFSHLISHKNGIFLTHELVLILCRVYSDSVLLMPADCLLTSADFVLILYWISSESVLSICCVSVDSATKQQISWVISLWRSPLTLVWPGVHKQRATTAPSSWSERHLKVFYIDEILLGYVVYLVNSRWFCADSVLSLYWFSANSGFILCKVI